MTTESPAPAPDAAVLVAVMADPRDFVRARDEGWYRIPLARAPRQIAAEYLAFYLTGAFEPAERWAVRWIAGVRGYHLATRRDLIPHEPAHVRAADRYYRVDLGPLEQLPRPIPSRRLRRITFIHTTWGRLMAAEEINDLWVRSPAKERLWRALQAAGLEGSTEHDYPLVDGGPPEIDFAVFGDGVRAAIMVGGDREEPAEGGQVRERAALDYILARGGWTAIYVDAGDPRSIDACLHILRGMGLGRSGAQQQRSQHGV